MEARSLDLADQWKGGHVGNNIPERQLRAQMRFTAELRSRLRAVCPLCAES